jgi:pilus assembly protein Flp/PilA
LQVLMSYFASLWRRDSGATMVEYGLLVAFIALVALVGVIFLGEELAELFNDIAGAL